MERIYGDQGSGIVDLLKKNPTVAVPVVLVRLAQKDAGACRRRLRLAFCLAGSWLLPDALMLLLAAKQPAYLPGLQGHQSSCLWSFCSLPVPAEWRKVREEMNKLWKKVFDQNYHRSLDHRSFYFKQADKKGLLPKSMLAEIRESADHRRADERHLRALAVGCPLSEILQPDLTYDYRESPVFEDVYQVGFGGGEQ